jgi:uncharacterized protein
MKKTLIIGASTNPERYSYKAAMKLMQHKYPIEMIGAREDVLQGLPIWKEKISLPDVHTVTIYVSAKNQHGLNDYITSLKPKRVIFNPGTENDELQKLLSQNGIECVEACTLVMLATGQY